MKNKIKICYIIDQLGIGGTENQLIYTVNLLDKDKFDPVIICLRDTTYWKSIKINSRKHTLGLYSLFGIKGVIKFIKLILFLRKEKFDIVQTFFIDSNFIGIIAAKIAGTKLIIGTRRDLGYWYSSPLLRKIKIINQFADRFLVNSNAILHNLNKYENVQLNKIDMIYNGIDLQKFQINVESEKIRANIEIPENDVVIGIVANLNRAVKRVDLFIKASKIVLSHFTNCTFLIIGEGDLKSELNNLIQSLQIVKKIKFLGSIANVHDYLFIFDIGVLTSDSEGFSNSILEYMAAGLPVICSDVGGNKEIIQSGVNGLKFQTGDYNSLALNIVKLIENEDLRKTISINNLNMIKEYSFERHISILTKYYQDNLYKKAYRNS